MLGFQLRNLERAMLGIAADGRDLFVRGPAEAPSLLGNAVRGVLDRHAELESVVVVDARGAAITAGRGDPALPGWAVDRNRGRGSVLYVGPPETVDGQLLLRLAVPMDAGRWVLARLRTRSLQALVAGLDVGRHGVVRLSTREGRRLADSGAARPDESADPEVAGSAALQSLGERVGADGVHRIAAAGLASPYPLRVFAGLDKGEVIARGGALRIAALLICLLYLAGFGYLLYSLRQAARGQARLRAELRAGDEDLWRAQRAGGIGTWSIGLDGQSLHWSAQTAQMFQTSLSGLPLREFLQRVHPQDRRRALRALHRARSGDVGFDISCRLLLPGHGERWIAARGAPAEHGRRRRRMSGTVVDVSERVEIQALARGAQHQFRLIFELNPLPCWLFDAQTLAFLEVNPAAVREYGYSREQFLHMRLPDISLSARDAEAMAGTPPGEASSPLSSVHRRQDGSRIDVRVHTSPLEIAGIRARLALAENVSEHLVHQRELAYRASHETVTGLLTVRALAEWLDRGQAGARYGIAHVQLRGLQLIGDTLGRETGEAVLRNLSLRLQTLAGRYGWLAFQPAEDFVFAIAGEHPLDTVVDALAAALSEPVRGRDSFHQLDPRIGLALHPEDGQGAEHIIGKAAQAAHAAREDGTGVLRFHAGIEARLSERLRRAGRLQQAIDRGEFVLHYQPIFDCASRRPVALEALLRWRGEDGRLLPPDEFIQLCEDSGLILPLGRWALRQAAQDQRRIVDGGWPALPTAVNVSALQFHHGDLASEVAEASGAFGLPRGALHVELTESSLMRQPQRALAAMHALRAGGVCISLDDFGTGFSSLSYLQHMPLDSLKIDRSFVTDVDRNARNASICRALITLGHDLGLKMIAEGVEQASQLDWLLAHGCDQVQGYLLGRPLPLEALLESLREHALSA